MAAAAGLSKLMARWRRDERATVGVIFGLSVLPMMGLVGVAVDYARASLVRTELQAAVDAAALGLAKDAVELSAAAAEARGRAHFNANWQARHNATLTSFTVTREAERFRVRATARVEHAMMQVLGAAAAEVGATGVSGWGLNRIEIALVLDNTGSMGWSNKMPELKKALCGVDDCSNTNPTAGFVHQMREASRATDQIRVALVPFDTTVRVPSDVQSAVVGGSAIADSFTASGAGYCGARPTTASRVAWTLSGVPGTGWLRFAERDKDTVWGGGCGAGRVTRATWQGCLWDRDEDLARDTTPAGVDTMDIRTLYPAVTCRSNNLARMAPLVDVRSNTASLITSLAAMQPSGNTNVTIGATWGVNMLTPGMPMSTAAAAQPNLSRFMILLTDGDNTENRRTGSSSAIDARTRLACANAKAQGIVVYSVRVIEGNRDLLRECASSPANYYEVSAASQLDAVFRTIASQIGSIRLTN
jgi:Flp pilus assembly protein TadG